MGLFWTRQRAQKPAAAVETVARFADGDKAKVDKKTLADYITGNAAESQAKSQLESGRQLGTWVQSYMDGPPQEQLRQVSAVQSNTSAHGFFTILDESYFNLFDEMVRKDPTLAAALRLVVTMILRRGVKFTTDDRGDRAAEIRDEIEKNLQSVSTRQSWGNLTWSLIHGSILHGVSVAETIWEPKGALDVPKAYIHRHPGMFTFDHFGTPYRYTVSSTSPPPLPAYKFCIMDSPALYGNPWGQSAIDTLQFLYEFKKQVLKDWILFIANYGLPLLVAKTQQSGTAFAQLKAKLVEIFANLRGNSAITLPQGVDVEGIARSAGQTGNLHREFIRYADECMILLLFGPILGMLDSEHNARSATETHSGTTQIALKPTAERLGESITRDLCVPFRVLNYGENSPEVVCQVDTEDAIDVTQLIDSVDAFRNWGLPVSERQIRERMDLPKPEEDDEIQPAPAPPPGGGLPPEINSATNSNRMTPPPPGGVAEPRTFRGRIDYAAANREGSGEAAKAARRGFN